uniref:Trichome birefringence-like C-terminal domain-containing protein n=1 Tax=Brassica oleracea var. oleracea TaxID=109376 RepID=A0A0D3AKD5_BRAOL
MRFPEHNVTVEYHRTPFLVVVARPPENSPEDVKMIVRVDEFNWQSKRWVGSDVLVFIQDIGGTKTKPLTCKLNKTMGVMEGFKKSLKTWKSWVLEKLDHESSYVFFGSFSPVHYRNGTWNLGGLCDADTNPETDMKKMEPDPIQNTYVSEVIQEMRYEHSKVKFLNL